MTTAYFRRLLLRGSDWLNRRLRRTLDSSAAFYPANEFCQIPGLSGLFELYLGRKADGVFVEVGANDGVYVSNTWGLAERGWRGLMIEPVPELAAACVKNHLRHLEVSVIQSAVGAPGVQEVELHLAGALTTASSDVLNEYRGLTWAQSQLTQATITVPCSTLNGLLDSHGIQPGFDVLVVDVEGFESDVFLGFDVAKWMPRLMIVELTDSHAELRSRAVDDAHLQDSILDSGYSIVFKDMANTVFVRRDVRRDTLVGLG